MDHNTALVVQDVLLFASRWETQFTSDDTPLTFTTGSGETVEVKALSDSFFVRVASGQGWQAVPAALRRKPRHGCHSPGPGNPPVDVGRSRAAGDPREAECGPRGQSQCHHAARRPGSETQPQGGIHTVGGGPRASRRHLRRR
ncbi:MAG: hypothetical protein HG423_011295 [Propionibacterium sp.]|nr:hypothetical protein [Propionibacterium sp.]